MKGKTPNLNGISFEGIPLKPEDFHSSGDETAESIKEDLREMRRTKKRIKPKPKYIKGTGRRGKRSPVRLLSQEEIKDYEFERKLKMAKKRQSERTMRALAFLFDETYGTEKWIGTEHVANHLGIPKSSTSGLMTIIGRKMKDVVETKFDDKKILRRVKSDAPFNNAREFVEEFYRRDGRKAKKRKAVTPRPLKPKPKKKIKTRDAMQRALRFIFARGQQKGKRQWVQSQDVAKALKTTIRSASGLVSRIDKRMGDLLIVEDIGVGGFKKFRRKINPETCTFATTEEFVDEFYKRGPKFDKKVEPTAEAPPEVKPELDEPDQKLLELEKEVREGVEAIAKKATEALAEILNAVDRRIDLNLNVTGEVKFRFLVGEEK